MLEKVIGGSCCVVNDVEEEEDSDEEKEEKEANVGDLVACFETKEGQDPKGVSPALLREAAYPVSILDSLVPLKPTHSSWKLSTLAIRDIIS
jgi:hypothetical protein